MNNFVKTGLVVVLSSTVSLASFAASDKSGDLTASVVSEIGKNAALRADHLTVETVNGVIYVHGMVDTDLERAEAGAAAIKAANGAKVVNMTETFNN